MDIEREHAHELNNMKARMNEIRQKEVDEVKTQMGFHEQAHNNEKARWESILLQRGEEIERQNQ